ncbi:MAG: hypothetical protein ABSG36_14120 [Acidimicrobiales bacterium]|jgi:hypothetical protein
MASDAPLSRLVLRATSVADDLGYVALADLAHVFGKDADYRVIGGHMVTALVARWNLGAELYRETDDTDIGVPPIVIQNGILINGLKGLGYEQVEGNRFARRLTDVPVRISGDEESTRLATIDVLVGAYTSRPRTNHKVGEFYTTEVPGLPTALMRDPVTMGLELHRLNGEVLNVELCFPDEVSALVLKGLATEVRTRGTDFVDLWRCLEVGLVAGITPDDFEGEIPERSVNRIRGIFSLRDGVGMTALVEEQRLSAEAADERFTRLSALVIRVLGSS